MARRYFLKTKKKRDHGLTEEDYERIRQDLKDPNYVDHLVNGTADKLIDEVGEENLRKIIFGEEDVSN